MKFDMNKMLQEAQRMQAELAKAQEEAASEVVEASAGGGMVTVKANGAGEVVSITIDPRAIDPDDPELLADLVLAAVNEALRSAQSLAQSKLGGMSGLEHDLIPFGLAVGDRARLQGLNLVGLKRRGFAREQIHTLRNAYRLLFAPEGTLMERLDEVETMFAEDAGVAKIVGFIRARSDRALCLPEASVG